jgi:hypothetical protein
MLIVRFVLGKIQLPSLHRSKIEDPDGSLVKKAVIFQIKQEIAEPEKPGKRIEEPVIHRIKKYAIRMVVLRWG